jgi:flagellar hook assembly protein FlgD
VLTPSPLSLASGAPLNIRYEQNEAARAEIEVLNSAGQVIRYLGAWQESAGIYNRTWDRRNAAGVVVAPATYTVRLRVTDLAGNVATLTRSVQVQP